jgi:hypothetical protein
MDEDVIDKIGFRYRLGLDNGECLPIMGKIDGK